MGNNGGGGSRRCLTNQREASGSRTTPRTVLKLEHELLGTMLSESPDAWNFLSAGYPYRGSRRVETIPPHRKVAMHIAPNSNVESREFKFRNNLCQPHNRRFQERYMHCHSSDRIYSLIYWHASTRTRIFLSVFQRASHANKKTPPCSWHLHISVF